VSCRIKGRSDGIYELLPYLLVIISALLHAGYHTFLKASSTDTVARIYVSFSVPVIVAPALLFFPLEAEVWGWLALSVAIKSVGAQALIGAYRTSDLSVAYPLARGLAPLGTAAATAVLMPEHIGYLGLAGIACISLGVLALALGRHVTRPGLNWALLQAVCVVGYTIVDARAVRLTDAGTYILWDAVACGCVMLLMFVVHTQGSLAPVLREQGRKAILAGVVAYGTYGLVLIAYQWAPVSSLAALRETSILFATCLAAFWLKEHLPRDRWIAAAGIGAGASLIVAGA
jgi:drug/metabolite transporter (DMT)-like permease